MEALEIPTLVIETDVERKDELSQRGVQTLFGDAANSEVLTHSRPERALALVITVPDETAGGLIVAAAHDLAPELPIITRAATEAGVHHLAELGARHVIHPELEGGLELIRHTLLELGFPMREVLKYSDAIRQEHYMLHTESQKEHRLLHELLRATDSIEIMWFHLTEDSRLVGKSLAQANLRALTGASVVGILRDRHFSPNPKSQTIFQAGDRVAFIGDPAQIEALEELL